MGNQTTDFDRTRPNECCNMEGVTCEVSDVVVLHWIYKGLTGPIPSEFGNLTNLEEL